VFLRHAHNTSVRACISVEQLERVLAASADDVANPAELRRYLDRSRKALEIDRTIRMESERGTPRKQLLMRSH